MALDQTEAFLAERIRRAASAVEQSNVDDEYRVPAFECVLQVLLDGSSSGHQAEPNDGAATVDGHTPKDGLLELARQLNVTEDRLEAFYRLGDGEVQLVAPARALPSAKAEATRLIAILVAAGRHSVLGEREVDIKHVRDACDYFGVYDSANFMRALQGAAPMISLVGRKGSSQRSIRLLPRGWDSVRDVVVGSDHASSGHQEGDHG